MEYRTEICFDEPSLTLTWEPDGGIICARWKGAVPAGPMREGLGRGLELVREKQAAKWLVDSRTFTSIDPMDAKWVNDVWVPRAVDAGIRWMAFVMAKKVVMRITIKTFIARINDREIANAYFQDVDDARAWLLAQG